MTTNTSKNFNDAKAGFTLVEVVIALGILVVMITGFMAVFGPAARTIKKNAFYRRGESIAGDIGT